MKWVDGTEIDVRDLSGEDICEKLAIEMYDTDSDQWMLCDECIRNALYIIDFDTETNMEGFSTPYLGNFSADYYAKIKNAFRTIGDDKDADLIEEALRLDSDYTKRLDNADNDEESDRIYNEFREKLGVLEERLYLNTDFDMWSLLYKYLDERIKEL